MSSVGYATLDVIPSLKGLQKRLDAEVVPAAKAAGKNAGSQMGEAASKEAGGKIRSHFSKELKQLGAVAAGAFAGRAIVGYFSGAIRGASDAEQAIGGVHAVFGKYADEVEARSKTAAQSLGLTSTAYQQLVTVSGALLKNKGLEDFAAQAEQLVQTGADLAAQFGGSTKQAVEALNAAMRGESDPIERYAISLNETSVQAELAARGQKKLTGAALEQAKAQARLAIIQKQSADAQGTFAREADTLAGQQQRLSAQWQEMQTTLGMNLLPVVTQFVGAMNNGVLPAIESVGGGAADMVRWFNELPPPVKSAAAALVAFKVAARFDLGGKMYSTLSGVGGVLGTVRTRALFAADAFRIAGGSANRMAAGLAAARVAASGTGTVLRGALGLVGGPWGAAFIGGTAILTHFWQEHRKAKARVQELTDTLDKQTGAATENTRALVAKRLEDQGLLEVAERLGLKTADVTTAVIEQGSALDDIVDKLRNIEAANRVHTGQGAILFSMGRDAIDLREELTQTDSELNKATASFYANAEAARRVEEATGGAAAATGKSGKAYDDLTTKVNKARDAIFKLIDAENKKRNNALAVRGDQIALNQAMLDLKKQATEGAKGLKLNTQAGLDNNRALQDLASQWANSEQKVKNADGAYRRIRASFIDAATEMGATKKQAKELADRLLETPRKVEIKTSVPGLEAAIEAYERLAAAARRAYEARRGGVVRNAGGLQARADGGPVSRFTPYVVGERGPEIFMPKSDGQIIPNHQIRTGNGGGTPVGGGLTEADAKMLAKAMAPTLYDAVYRGMAQQQDISIGRGR